MTTKEILALVKAGFTPEQIVEMQRLEGTPQAASPVAAPPSSSAGNAFFRDVIVARAQRRSEKVAAGTHKVASCGHVVRVERTAPRCKRCTYRR